MSRYRFSWNAFDDLTVEALAVAEGYGAETSEGGSRAFLDCRVSRPDVEFVRQHKATLARVWIREYDGGWSVVARLRDAGVGPRTHPRTRRGYSAYVARCRNSEKLRRILLEALLCFGDRDRDDRNDRDVESDSRVPRFALLVPALKSPDPRAPHDYQVEAWHQLDQRLLESEKTGVIEGIVAMPTGAGKTFTACRWLVNQALSRGMRVLWIAHRHELLRHAAAEFHQMAGLVTGVDKLRVRIVSGKHCTMTQIDPADHVVIASIHSLRTRPEIRDELLSDPRLFVVIDEAHHAPASSYRAVIQQLRRASPHRLIGLTATPTRTEESERPVLSTLFGGRMIYRVEFRRLVERRTLARPHLVSVATKADVEGRATSDDLAHLSRFDDLSAAWLTRIGEIAERNRLIVDHYVEHREKYGPTIVFAVDVAHAALLADQLRERGVRADYVACYRPDNTETEADALIASLRRGDLDVLVNVQKLTEGVDVPNVQTVFLTRPTRSEILLRQMVGRALRGPLAGGTENAYLVAFDDQWKRFRDWEHPFDLVPDLVELAKNPSPEGSRAHHDIAESLPWHVIRETVRRLRRIAPHRPADVFEAIPHGWYLLERETSDATVRHVVPVYAHQQESWEELVEFLFDGGQNGDGQSGSGQSSDDEIEHFDAFFAECGAPLPAMRDIELTVDHRDAGGDLPTFTPLSARRLSDPREIARAIREDDLGERARLALIEGRYGPLARTVYATLRDFDAAITDALRDLRFPGDVASPAGSRSPQRHALA